MVKLKWKENKHKTQYEVPSASTFTLPHGDMGKRCSLAGDLETQLKRSWFGEPNSLTLSRLLLVRT